MNDIEDPAEFDRAFKILKDDLLLIQEIIVDGEKIPKIILTERGIFALQEQVD